MTTTAKTPASDQIAQALFDASYPHGRLVNQTETEWASRTFSGVRHSFTIRFDGPGSHTFAESLVELIGDDDVPLQGHLVVDMTVPIKRFSTEPECYAEIVVEALTLEVGA